MVRTYEPGEPDPRDLQVLAALRSRDGVLTEVVLFDGQRLRVWNIAWGYDEADCWAHVTSSCSPFVGREALDVFFTSDVETVRDPGSDLLLVGPPEPRSG